MQHGSTLLRVEPVEKWVVRRCRGHYTTLGRGTDKRDVLNRLCEGLCSVPSTQKA